MDAGLNLDARNVLAHPTIRELAVFTSNQGTADKVSKRPSLIDLDTDAVERMFKSTILLRKKNALFIGSDKGAQALGIHASIVETCKLNGVNVEPYLKWVVD